MEDERLPRVLHVASSQKERLDACVSRIPECPVVQGQVYIDAADVKPGTRWQDELWNPSADDHDVIAVLTQQVDQFQQDGSRRLDLVGRVVAEVQRHETLMTSSRIADAASAPRPLAWVKSRYIWTGDTTGALSTSAAP